MPTGEEQSYSNPSAPPSHQLADDDHRLTNADFRTLLMTPRDTPKSAAPPIKQRPGVPKSFDDADDAYAKRKKKKLYYAKLKKQEEERMKELSEKYRDRALERREGKNSDYQHNDAPDLAKTAEYRAVAPTADQVNSAAERRRLAIQESKFLGGDMEHTHLVKGLDFALLQKVRSEIANIDNDEPTEEEQMKAKKDSAASDIEFNSILGRKIHKAALNVKPQLRNELFFPGRMGYLFHLDEEVSEDTDIPTTSIRSKADCPLVENQATLTTNDIVINKLTQILSYLRQGMRANKKLKKREKELIRAGKDPRMEDNIYGDLGDMVNEFNKHDKYASRNQQKNFKYFDSNRDAAPLEYNRRDASVKDLVKNINDKFERFADRGAGGSSEWQEVTTDKSNKKRSKPKPVVDSYAECYPGAAEMDDAVNDSDDDADYSKMDLGNKKGPVKRWDFENEDDYNKYMENREAMPKAAFQFGIKMQEGRKTRSRPGNMSEKQKLDREWQQISSLISKRKKDGGGESGGKRYRDY